jgi:CxxC motif-containing protein (DUF1111 family)
VQYLSKWKHEHDCGRAGSLLAVAVSSVLSLGAIAAAQGFGDPLPGLSAEELAEFEDAREEFKEVETAASGLGPTFNAQGCATCHSKPAVGGSNASRNEVRAGQVINGTFFNLPGGSVFQIFAIRSECSEVVPPEANVIAERQTQPLFGMGLVEAIPEGTITARADPDDLNGDGISGRAATVFDPATNRTRLGRFGWKAQIASLLGFSGDAYLIEMGITNDLFPREEAPNGDTARLIACDAVPDPEDVAEPETGSRDIDEFTTFMQLLGPPPRGKITAAVTAGESVFNRIGCASCHTPVMTTGPNEITALDRKPVPLFSDLLLHDVGTGDGIAQADAAPNEIRTQPLWGLRVSGPFLHDGSAQSVEAAILRHAGEASRVTANFRALTAAERDQLLAFLGSL